MLAAHLLRAWEEGVGRSPVERSLLAFALARPGRSAAALLEAGLGERDGALIGLRCSLFGAMAEAVADCPVCRERLDLGFDLRDLVLPVAERPLLRVRDLVDAPREPSAFRAHLLARAGVGDPAEVEAADPQASLTFDLLCAACGHAWPEPFDIGRFLWAELEDWAMRTMRDVHALASAYGWREDEVLSLSPTRRAVYLSMVGAG